MLIGTTIVFALTAALGGAKAAGVLASFPVFGTILAIFANRIRGAAITAQVLRGMVLALYGFATLTSANIGSGMARHLLQLGQTAVDNRKRRIPAGRDDGGR
ncbi:hypothetical protein EOW77_0033675 [Bradyrhizobium yuanmingense]|uniref:hypothetical protein n=1 Tax=Bradyrhizobium yuanmingense TaxID=108015 RepID=UPI000FE2A550|nr:hypothetical protein [Bradyrhizobium yuanmingense]TGN74444.1 hypothetical protein EOW77_0033675 [Bradyrhizobium yuanmingense]